MMMTAKKPSIKNTPPNNTSTAEVASILKKCCDESTLVEIVHALLGADDNEDLTGREANVAKRIFDTLTD